MTSFSPAPSFAHQQIHHNAKLGQTRWCGTRPPHDPGPSSASLKTIWPAPNSGKWVGQLRSSCQDRDEAAEPKSDTAGCLIHGCMMNLEVVDGGAAHPRALAAASGPQPTEAMRRPNSSSHFLEILILCRRDSHALWRGIVARRQVTACLLYTSPSPRDGLLSRMPSSA